MNYDIQVSGSYLLIKPKESLTTNRVYTIHLDEGIVGFDSEGFYTLDQKFTFWFTSLYCPIFSTPTKIRLEAGPSTDVIADDTIYRMIHKNSLDAVDILNTAMGTALTYDYWGCTWHDVPYNLRRYVECKTAYDLLSLIQALSSGAPGGGLSQQKALGDMSIRYGGASGSASKALDFSKMKQLYDCFMEFLRYIQTLGIRTAVRGLYDSSKGFSHPVMEPHHNRVIRPVSFTNTDPNGPWVKGRPWRGFRYR